MKPSDVAHDFSDLIARPSARDQAGARLVHFEGGETGNPLREAWERGERNAAKRRIRQEEKRRRDVPRDQT